jgi:hypothetical protein
MGGSNPSRDDNFISRTTMKEGETATASRGMEISIPPGKLPPRPNKRYHILIKRRRPKIHFVKRLSNCGLTLGIRVFASQSALGLLLMTTTPHQLEEHV